MAETDHTTMNNRFWSSMVIRTGLFLTLVFSALVSIAADSDKEEAKLTKLRKEYQEASSAFRKVKRPTMGQPNFHTQLGAWSAARKEYQAAARGLIPALLTNWSGAPDKSPKSAKLAKEIKTVVNELCGNPRTAAFYNEQSFFARQVWSLLASGELTPKQAKLVAELTQPMGQVRQKDDRAAKGLPTEPFGWDIQATHALALIQSGDLKDARAETDRLTKKVSINHGVRPNGRLDYGPEAGDRRYRDYVDYLQLCHLLHGLQDSVEKDHASAKAQIKKARELREKLTPEASQLLEEINRNGKKKQT